jgi:DNA-binding NarL/FixJ family response regulator
MISVPIADDHPLLIEGSALILESDVQRRFTAVGAAASA